MMRLKAKKAFTLIELLVVISIIALLLTVIMPSLRKAKEQARKVVCMSNLSQVAKCVEMYEMDNDYKRIAVRLNATDTDTYWMGRIAPYAGNEHYADQYRLGEKIDLLLCPSAPYGKFEYNADLEVGGTGQIGTAAAPWEWKRSADLSTIGSYGINGYLAYDYLYEDPDSGAYDAFKGGNAYQNWMRTPGNVPLFGCARWTIGWPKGVDPVPPTLVGEQMIVSGVDMERFCIDRHNKRVNLIYKDLSTQSVELQDLWQQRWHKNYEYPTTTIVLPGR